MVKKFILPWVAWLLYIFWTGTWRKRILFHEKLKPLLDSGAPLIFAHWHGDELAITFLVSRFKIATMTSTSADGQIIDFVIRRLGGGTSRGSSTRGGVSALKGLVRLVRQGYRASMAVDGPKGPLHAVKPGVFELSRLTKAYIVPVGVACDRAYIFEKSWNKAKLPKVFSSVVIYFGEPWSPLDRTLDARDKSLATRLAQGLSDAGHQAGKLIAEPLGRC